MTEIAMPVSNKITRDSPLELKFKEISAKMGDGYDQVAPLGLNPVIESYEISWAGLTQVEYQQVLTAIKTVGTWGVLLWTPPDETVQKKFRIPAGSGFKRTRARNGVYQASVSIEECFDLTV